MIKSILLVGLGSCAGGILRYLVSLALPPRGSGFPTATFIVNIAGCLLIGLFSKYSETPSALCLLLTTGLCGGFTTFSTFSNEAVTMLQGGNIQMFLLYVIGSVICGILATGILATLGGYALIRLL